MYARYVIINGDPAKIDAAVDLLERVARPQVEALDGNRGYATLTGLEARLTLGASYWDDAEAMAASDPALAPLRDRIQEAAGGPLSVEEYEVAVAFRQSIPGHGTVVRLSRTETEPDAVDDAVGVTRDRSLPRLKGAPGLCSFQWLVNRESGHGLVVTAWENEKAAEAFWPTAQDLRAQLTERVGTRFTGVEHYSMIRTSVALD